MTWFLASPGLQQPKCLSIQTNRALFLLWVELPFSCRIKFNELYKMQRHMSSASRSFVNGRLSIKALYFHFPFRYAFVCVCVCGVVWCVVNRVRSQGFSWRYKACLLILFPWNIYWQIAVCWSTIHSIFHSVQVRQTFLAHCHFGICTLLKFEDHESLSLPFWQVLCNDGIRIETDHKFPDISRAIP